MAPARSRPCGPAPGEDHGIRRPPGVRADEDRSRTRRSLVFFGQLTDPQIADEMSPARVDFVDPAGGASSSSWRPQEALGLQVFDQTVRNMNDNRTSELRAGGKRAKLGFAITTGDLADNQQFNETTWFKTRARRRARSTRSPASRSAPRTRARRSAGDRRGAQRRGRRPALHRRRRLRRLRRRARRPLRRLLGPGRRRARPRTPPSRATRGCWSAPRTRSRPRA